MVSGIVKPDTAKTLADQELLKAIAECMTYVEGWRRRQAGLSPLLALLKNRLHFLLHEIDEENAVYTVFEVLNSRGLDVSWIDRLKSIYKQEFCCELNDKEAWAMALRLTDLFRLLLHKPPDDDKKVRTS